MTDKETKTDNEIIDVQEQLELAKQNARLLGIKHSGNISLSTLNDKIKEHLLQNQGIEKSELSNYQKINKLVRVIVNNLGSNDSYKPGDYITFSNAQGTVRKFVAYGEACGKGYHIPEVFLDFLRSKKMAYYKPVVVDGMDTHERVVQPKFNITICDPLTPEELEALKQRQIATRAID